MTRTLLTAIFLTLFSQTAWSFDCDLISNRASESVLTIKIVTEALDGLRTKVSSEKDGQYSLSETKHSNRLLETESKHLDKLYKWATIYNAFCK